MKYKNYLAKITPEEQTIKGMSKTAYIEEFAKEIKNVIYLTYKVSRKRIEPFHAIDIIVEECTFNQNLDVDPLKKIFKEKNSGMTITYREILEQYYLKMTAIREAKLIVFSVVFIGIVTSVYSLFNY